MNDKILPGTYKELAKKIANGNCILFLGAGASYGDRNEEDIPKASDFAEELCCKLKKDYHFRIKKEAGLPKITQCYQIKENREALEKFIKEEIGLIKDPLRIHKIITKLPFKIIITTNYDRLLENQFDNEVRADDYKVIIDTEDLIKKWDNLKIMILKIHGTFESGSNRGLVITEDDYIKFLSEENLIKFTLRFIFATKIIIFIGYSLSDYNVRVLLKQITPDNINNYHYLIQDSKIDSEEFNYWEKKGIKLYEKDGTEFLKEIQKEYESLKTEDKIGDLGKFQLDNHGTEALDYWEDILVNKFCKDISEEMYNKQEYKFSSQYNELFSRTKNQKKLIELFDPDKSKTILKPDIFKKVLDILDQANLEKESEERLFKIFDNEILQIKALLIRFLSNKSITLPKEIKEKIRGIRDQLEKEYPDGLEEPYPNISKDIKKILGE